MITRVYGKADTYELEFHRDSGTWCASVPADLSDGKYVCEIWALDSFGFTAYYTGILYMFDGKAIFRLLGDDIIFKHMPDSILVSLTETVSISLQADNLIFIYTGDENGVKTEFILGEEKTQTFTVKSTTGKTLVITDAKFTLNSNGKVIQQGACDIDGENIRCLIKPTELGSMYLEIEYVIAPETRKARIEINVI